MKNSLQRSLLILGFIAIPFYEIIFRFFPYVQVHAMDTRVTKELVSMMIALAIGLTAVFQGSLKPFKNKFFLILIGYLFFSYFMSPFIPLAIDNVNSSNFWFWKPMVQVLCFSMMIFAVASMDFDISILKVAMLCGVAMSVYVILQNFGFDQFWAEKQGDEFIQVTQRGVGGSLGSSVVVSSFIVTLIPIAMFFKKYFSALIMVSAVVICKSDMASITLVFVVLALASRVDFRIFLLVFLTGIFLMIFGVNKFINDADFHKKILDRGNGRFQVWKQTIQDFRDGPIEGMKSDYSMTGTGLGSFPHFFTQKHNSTFQQAHNDPIEFLYQCGIVGLTLMVFSLGYMFLGIILGKSPGLSFHLSISFISLIICSLGLFVFQLGAHQFYASFLIGLLHNESIIGGKYERSIV